ncbi:MAG: DUF3459 domain-containing protein, partial [Propioniciclava sp.]
RRARPEFRTGELSWLDLGAEVVAFRRGDSLAVVVNFGSAPVSLPAGEVLLTSAPLVEGLLPLDATTWIAL